MKFVLIFGPHLSGKKTVGQELQKITGLKLFHNHMTVDLVSNFFDAEEDIGKMLSDSFQMKIFEEYSKSKRYGMIYTYTWALNQRANWEYVDQLLDLFETRGGEVYLVELKADFDVRIERNKTARHLTNQKDIEYSENLLRHVEVNHRLNSYEGEIKWKNYICIDNTNLSPAEVANMIKETFEFYHSDDYWMKIETERLLLRDYTPDNFAEFYELKTTEEVWEYSSFVPYQSKEGAKAAFRAMLENKKDNPYQFCALYLKDTMKFIGEAGILSYHSESNRFVIGYNLFPEFWNSGYATEITRALISYVFRELKAERIEALSVQKNAASCKVLEKSGFQLEGVLRNFAKIRGKYENVCYYAMIASDQALKV